MSKKEQNNRAQKPEKTEPSGTAKIIMAGIAARARDYRYANDAAKEETRKTILKGTTTALLTASLLSGLVFTGPAEINQETTSIQLDPAPVVLDIDDYVNAPTDDEDDGDEQKGAKAGVVSRFKQAVLSLPQAVRLLIITPLWAIGTALMTMVSFLWSVIFSSPLGAFIASFAIGFALLFGLFAVTAKMFFPGVPLKKILSKKGVLALGITALVLAGADAAMPLFWHQYPYYAALLKLGVGALIIGILLSRVRKLNPLNALKTV